MGSVIAMTIAGTDITGYLRHQSLEITKTINSRPVLRCGLATRLDSDPYRPAVNSDVVVTDTGMRVFGGVLYTLVEGSVVNYLDRAMQVDAVGYELYADTSLINGIVNAGTLQSQM